MDEQDYHLKKTFRIEVKDHKFQGTFQTGCTITRFVDKCW